MPGYNIQPLGPGNRSGGQLYSHRTRSAVRSEENVRPFGEHMHRIEMYTLEPIVPVEDIVRIGPSTDPWRGLLSNINRLSAEGVFPPETRSIIRDHVRWALYAKVRLDLLTTTPNTSVNPYDHSGRTGYDELYYRTVEHLFLQFEVFRRLRGILKGSHSHMASDRRCNGVCPALLTLHVLLAQFREANRPTSFDETTLGGSHDGPLQMHPRIMRLRRAMIQSDCFDGLADIMARYVAKISSHAVDDEEWEECMQQITLLRPNHPYDRPFRGPRHNEYGVIGDWNGGENMNVHNTEGGQNGNPRRNRDGSFHHRELSHHSGSVSNGTNRPTQYPAESASGPSRSNLSFRNTRYRTPSVDIMNYSIHHHPLPVQATTRSPPPRSPPPNLNPRLNQLYHSPLPSLPPTWTHHAITSRRSPAVSHYYSTPATSPSELESLLNPANNTRSISAPPSPFAIPRTTNFVSSRTAPTTQPPPSLRSTPSRSNPRFFISSSSSSSVVASDDPPLSLTSRPPTHGCVSRTPRWLHSRTRVRGGRVQESTEAEAAYLDVAEEARRADEEGVGAEGRRVLAVRVQEALERVDGGDEWEVRARVLREMEWGRGRDGEDNGEGDEEGFVILDAEGGTVDGEGVVG